MTTNEFERYTTPAPLSYEPQIFEDTRQHISRAGGVVQAIAEILRSAGILTEVEGETSAWRQPGKGVILIGDHRDGTESIPQVASLADLGRTDQHYAANPFSLQARVIAALGAEGMTMLLPVIPRSLTRDAPCRLDRHLYWRLQRHGSLPTGAEAAVINDLTLDHSAGLVAEGRAVTVYPAGGVKDATRSPWRPGIGEIIRRLPAESYDKVTIVPIRAYGHSTLRLAGAIAAHRMGLTLPAWKVCFRVGRQGSIAELLGDDVTDAIRNTEALRQQYVESFGSST